MPLRRFARSTSGRRIGGKSRVRSFRTAGWKNVVMKYSSQKGSFVLMKAFVSWNSAACPSMTASGNVARLMICMLSTESVGRRCVLPNRYVHDSKSLMTASGLNVLKSSKYAAMFPGRPVAPVVTFERSVFIGRTRFSS